MGKLLHSETASIVRFFVELDGKSYRCVRRISGTRQLRQNVYVEQLGQQDDSTVYGEGGNPITCMDPRAHSIARDIIRTAGSRV